MTKYLVISFDSDHIRIAMDVALAENPDNALKQTALIRRQSNIILALTSQQLRTIADVMDQMQSVDVFKSQNNAQLEEMQFHKNQSAGQTG